MYTHTHTHTHTHTLTHTSLMEVYSRKPIKAGELLYYTPLLHYFTTLIHRETPHGDVLEEAYPGGGTVAGAAGPHPEALTCVPGRSRPLGASVPVLCMWGHLYLSCVCVHVCMCVRMYVHTHGGMCACMHVRAYVCTHTRRLVFWHLWT